MAILKLLKKEFQVNEAILRVGISRPWFGRRRRLIDVGIRRRARLVLRLASYDLMKPRRWPT